MRRYVIFGNGSYVTMRYLTVIGRVRSLGKLVPFAGEDALAPDGLKSKSNPTDASKKVNKSKRAHVLPISSPRLHAIGEVFLEECLKAQDVLDCVVLRILEG